MDEWRGKSQRRSQEEFERLAREKHPTVDIRGEYKNQDSKFFAKCRICGYEWTPSAYSFLKGEGCPKCTKEKIHKSQRSTHDEFLRKLAQVNNKIVPLTEYKKAREKITCECSVCGNVWEVMPYNLLSGYGCPQCANMRTADRCRLDDDEFKKRIKKIFPDVEVIGKYINSKSKVLCHCNKCGNDFLGIPFNLYKGEGCPHCSEPKGEREIRASLDSMGVHYVQWKTFDDLLGIKGGKLSYDFFIPSQKVLIEFQGIQHVRPVEVFGGEAQFNVQVEHDRRKKEYAKTHNYKLLEIFYYQYDDIRNILKKEIENTTNIS